MYESIRILVSNFSTKARPLSRLGTQVPRNVGTFFEEKLRESEWRSQQYPSISNDGGKLFKNNPPRVILKQNRL